MLEQYSNTKQNFILVGESGCGKSEMALFLAKMFADITDRPIHLIDLDQTKGIFRSRDWKSRIENERVQVYCGEHFLDMPLVPHGMERMLSDEKAIHILDVGGNETGAVTLGQYEKWINGENSVVFYIINPCRNFSGTRENIWMLMERIAQIAHIQSLHIISNPNLGKDTTAQDIQMGHERLLTLLANTGYTPEALLIPDWVEPAALTPFQLSIYQMKPLITYAL